MEITIEETALPGPSKTSDELLAAGWVYRDVNWILFNYWTRLVEAMGDGNFSLLAMSKRTFPDSDNGVFCRGQFLVSPAGIEGIKRLSVQLKTERNIDSKP